MVLTVGLSGECPQGSGQCYWSFSSVLISHLSSFENLAIRIKKPIKTKFRLPVFNWTALKPNQINGTVFSELDDEKILEVTGVWSPEGWGWCEAWRLG